MSTDNALEYKRKDDGARIFAITDDGKVVEKVAECRDWDTAIAIAEVHNGQVEARRKQLAARYTNTTQ